MVNIQAISSAMESMICRHAMPVPTMEKIKDNAVMLFIAIRQDAMLMTCSIGVPSLGLRTVVMISGTLICDAAKTCKLPTDNPEAHAASSLVTSSSSTSNTTNGSHFFVLVVVSLLGAAMIAMQVVQCRPRVLLRRQQYSDVDATATRIDV